MTAIKMRSLRIAITTIALALSLQAEAQPSVTIEVHADHLQGSLPTSWNFFGYDEPNYSYAPNGKKLLNEIGRLSPTPAYTRVHNLFTTGDGSSSLKWGSTNVYTEDASGRPIYDWKIVDRIFFHISRLRAEAACRTRIHARGTLNAPGTIPAQLPERIHLHRLGIPAEGLSEVRRTRVPVHEASSGALR